MFSAKARRDRMKPHREDLLLISPLEEGRRRVEGGKNFKEVDFFWGGGGFECYL